VAGAACACSCHERFQLAEEGLTEKEIIRCLKRYVARQVYRHLRAGG